MNATPACELVLIGEADAEHELFRVELRPSATCELLILAGAISPEAVQQLSAAALQALSGGREVAVDWSAVTRLSASAAQVLLALRMDLHRRGLALSLMGENPDGRRTLELAGLSDLFPGREGAG